MSVDHYTYRVTWSAEDGEHVGLCAEFPSLSWLAKTPEAALKGIRRVVAEAVADMQAADEDIPVPLAEKHYSGEFRVRIPPAGERKTGGLKRIWLPPAAESPGRSAVPPAPTSDKYSPCQSFSLLLHLKQL